MGKADICQHKIHNGHVMIEFFTALVLHYEVQGQELTAVMWFETRDHCEQVAMSGIYDVIHDHYDDTMMYCEETDAPSRTIRPRARPEEMGNG